MPSPLSTSSQYWYFSAAIASRSSVFYSILNLFKTSSNLHEQNQKNLAQFFCHFVQHENPSKVIFSWIYLSSLQLFFALMSDLFSAKEQISVCFLSKFGDRSEELLRKIFSRQKKEALHFDPNYCGTFIELDETMQCATGTGYTYQVSRFFELQQQFLTVFFSNHLWVSNCWMKVAMKANSLSN